MKTNWSNVKYGGLGFVGLLLLCGALLDLKLLPKTEACANNPNCSSWAVDSRESGCHSLCMCGSNNISNTCYREVGVCNATGQAVVYEHCYQGGCCCPTGNCAGQGGGGGGGDTGGGGDWCYSDFDCDSGWKCNAQFMCEEDWID